MQTGEQVHKALDGKKGTCVLWSLSHCLIQSGRQARCPPWSQSPTPLSAACEAAQSAAPETWRRTLTDIGQSGAPGHMPGGHRTHGSGAHSVETENVDRGPTAPWTPGSCAVPPSTGSLCPRGLVATHLVNDRLDVVRFRGGAVNLFVAFHLGSHICHCMARNDTS
jgi:hypothetical protein